MALCFDASKMFGTRGTRKKVTFMGEEWTLVANNSQKKDGNAPAKAFCMHWEVDHHTTVWDDYDFCVGELADKRAVLVRTLAPGDKPQATWGRNTAILNGAFCAMAVPTDVPDDPMIQMAGRYIGEYCARHGIDPRGTIQLPRKQMVNGGASLVTVDGFITVPVIHDHCTIAEHDGYGPSGTGDRWDIGHPKVWGKPSLLPRVQAVAYATYDAVKAGQAYQLKDEVLR